MEKKLTDPDVGRGRPHFAGVEDQRQQSREPEARDGERTVEMGLNTKLSIELLHDGVASRVGAPWRGWAMRAWRCPGWVAAAGGLALRRAPRGSPWRTAARPTTPWGMSSSGHGSGRSSPTRRNPRVGPGRKGGRRADRWRLRPSRPAERSGPARRRPGSAVPGDVRDRAQIDPAVAATTGNSRPRRALRRRTGTPPAGGASRRSARSTAQIWSALRRSTSVIGERRVGSAGGSLLEAPL